MTVHKRIVRVHDTMENLEKFKIPLGMEMVRVPYKPDPDAEDNIIDVMFRTSDMNPCLSERLLMKDIDNEVERLKFIHTDRIRDTPLQKDKTYMGFQTFEDMKGLPDDFKSKSHVQFGDENKVFGNIDDKTNLEYVKAKKKYIQFIDEG